MAMQWIEEVRQTAIIDEADQLATRHLQPPYEHVRQQYATIGLDMVAFATELKELAREARDVRAQALSEQARYELESGQARHATDDARRWLEQMFLAARFARLRGHPLSEGIVHLFDDVGTDSRSQVLDALAAVLARADEVSTLTRYGLPADFLDRGRALRERLLSEIDDTLYRSSLRVRHTHRLQQVLREIVQRFEQLAAARDLVMALTGEDLPGLELSLVRAAAAPRPAREPLPEPPNGL